MVYAFRLNKAKYRSCRYIFFSRAKVSICLHFCNSASDHVHPMCLIISLVTYKFNLCPSGIELTSRLSHWSRGKFFKKPECSSSKYRLKCY